MDASATPPITPTNLLSKLSFVRFHGGLAEHGARFRQDLLDFLRRETDQLVSRQSIINWFKSSVPSRASAFLFLSRYLRELVDYNALDGDQKKVHSQVVRFLSNRVPALHAQEMKSGGFRIWAAERDRLAIDVSGTSAALMRLSNLEGVYLAFHARTTEDHKGMFTQEVLRIFRKGKELQFDLWYLKDGIHIEKYNGRVVLIGTIVWMLGATLKPPARLRVMNFRDIHSEGKKYTNLRCGLMLGDIPSVSSPDPVACRIAIMKVQREIDDIGKFARESVKNFRADGNTVKVNDAILRLIDNRKTAISTPHTFNPLAGPDGKPLVDSILKVDQVTTERVSEAVFGDVEMS